MGRPHCKGMAIGAEYAKIDKQSAALGKLAELLAEQMRVAEEALQVSSNPITESMRSCREKEQSTS